MVVMAKQQFAKTLTNTLAKMEYIQNDNNRQSIIIDNKNVQEHATRKNKHYMPRSKNKINKTEHLSRQQRTTFQER